MMLSLNPGLDLKPTCPDNIAPIGNPWTVGIDVIVLVRVFGLGMCYGTKVQQPCGDQS